MPVAASTPLEGSRTSPSARVLVVSGAITLLVVLLFSVTLSDLPMAMLGANLIRHAGQLIAAGVRGLDRKPRRQTVAALATAVSVMTLGPLYGMLIAVALTLLDQLKRVDSTHP
jgi:MFS superfamily sulfate permease-like transporter